MTEIELRTNYGGFTLKYGETLEIVDKKITRERETIENNSLKDAISDLVDEMISKGYTFDAFTLHFCKENNENDVDTVIIDGNVYFVKN